MIVAENITKYYGAHAAVQGISFTINKGEVVGLLGLNGAGKTTTLRVLSGLLVPTSGKINIDGVDVIAGGEDIRSRIGFLPETPPLYPEMTVEDFLTFVARIKGLKERDVKAAVNRSLKDADLEDRRSHVIETLSHGYKRRVGIAHAIVHSPPLILLDEPTSGLDPVQIVHMRQLIRGLKDRHTVIVSSHILSEISQMCDRILVLQRGRIVADATEESLGKKVAGASTITIEVRGTPATLASALGRVGAVQRHVVDRHEGTMMTATVDLTSDDREAVAKAIIDAGLGLRRLDRTSLELESIFMQLTGGNAAKEVANA
jgi:ABC-2 type transport system ATP-binding protein